MEPVTIVTAFYDINRGSWEGIANGRAIPSFIKRTTDDYFHRFARLAQLKNDIIVFTQEKFKERLLGIRDDLKIITWDNPFIGSIFKEIGRVQKDPTFISFIDNPALPEYWSPEYVMINYLKSYFVNNAIGHGYVMTPTTAWIDFGYCREDTYCPPGLEWKFDPQECINVFSNGEVDIFDAPSILEIVKTNSVYLQGCHIVAPTHMWRDLMWHMKESMDSLLKVGLVDDDQTLLLMACQSNPSKFLVNEGDSSNWFRIFEEKE